LIIPKQVKKIKKEYMLMILIKLKILKEPLSSKLIFVENRLKVKVYRKILEKCLNKRFWASKKMMKIRRNVRKFLNLNTSNK
jgi:hypothetical protein